MRSLDEIQADILRCCDIRKMAEVGELLDELTELFNAKDNETGSIED